MGNLYPCLWFDDRAEEAAYFYVSIFNNSKIGTIRHYDEQSAKAAKKQEGSVMTVTFRLNGQDFMALNGGPGFKFNMALSLFVEVKNARDFERIWNELSESGRILLAAEETPFSERYGLIQDKFGVYWNMMMGFSENIYPTIMFSGKMRGKADEAIGYYTREFEGSKVIRLERYGKYDADEGKVMVASIRLEGRSIILFDGRIDANKVNDDAGIGGSRSGSLSLFNESISLVLACKTQQELDMRWKDLSKGGIKGECGWLKDRFGISWQIIPTFLEEVMNEEGESENVIKALLSMKKIDISILKAAHEKDMAASGPLRSIHPHSNFKRKIFVNLPVKDLGKSMRFFSKLGFTFDERFTDKKAACMLVGDDIYSMLITDSFFKTFTKKKISSKKGTEVLIALSLQSKEEVDDIISKALKGGAKEYRKDDTEQMYTRAFEDLDGHQWELFWMDPAFVPQSDSSLTDSSSA